jgi:uncharacterized membrane protein (DUF373 family)
MDNQTVPEQQVPARRWHAAFQKMTGAGPSLDFYGRFEQMVALVLIFLISGVIIIGVAHLVFLVARDIFFPLGTSVDSSMFQEIFGMIMTVLIGLEFNHTILSILRRQASIVQLRTVVLIAILAMARKFLIIDVTALEPLVVIGLSFAILSLGCVYWLLRVKHRGQAMSSSPPSAE